MNMTTTRTNWAGLYKLENELTSTVILTTRYEPINNVAILAITWHVVTLPLIKESVATLNW